MYLYNRIRDYAPEKSGLLNSQLAGVTGWSVYTVPHNVYGQEVRYKFQDSVKYKFWSAAKRAGLTMWADETRTPQAVIVKPETAQPPANIPAQPATPKPATGKTDDNVLLWLAVAGAAFYIMKKRRRKRR